MNPSGKPFRASVIATAFAVMVAFTYPAHAQQVYSCVRSDGSIITSNEPCEEVAKKEQRDNFLQLVGTIAVIGFMISLLTPNSKGSFTQETAEDESIWRDFQPYVSGEISGEMRVGFEYTLLRFRP